MGLGFVELKVSVEQRFGIAIPDDVARRLRTPRQLIDHVCGLVGEVAGDGRCVSQHAFYLTRRVLMSAAELPRAGIRPGTPLESIVPRPRRRSLWPKLARQLGVPIRLRRPEWLTWCIAAAAATAFFATFAATAPGFVLDRVWHGQRGLAAALAAVLVLVIGLGATRRSAIGLRETAGDLALAAIPALVATERAEGSLWTRQAIAETIRQLIREIGGVDSFSDEEDFVRDLDMG